MTLQIIVKLFDHGDSEHEEKRRDEGNEETDAQGRDQEFYCGIFWKTGGIICDTATQRKNKLKKYLNWLKRTTGRKEYQVYLQLLIALDAYLLPLFFS